MLGRPLSHSEQQEVAPLALEEEPQGQQPPLIVRFEATCCPGVPEALPAPLSPRTLPHTVLSLQPHAVVLREPGLPRGAEGAVEGIVRHALQPRYHSRTPAGRGAAVAAAAGLSTITLARGGATVCHTLPMLKWLEAPPAASQGCWPAHHHLLW